MYLGWAYSCKSMKPTYTLAARLQALKSDKGWTIDDILERAKKRSPSVGRAQIGFIIRGRQGDNPAPYLGMKRVGEAEPLLDTVAAVLGLSLEEADLLATADQNAWRAWVRQEDRRERRKAARQAAVRRRLATVRATEAEAEQLEAGIRAEMTPIKAGKRASNRRLKHIKPHQRIPKRTQPRPRINVPVKRAS